MSVPKPTGYRGGPDGQTGYTIDVSKGHTIFTPFFDRASRVGAALRDMRQTGGRVDDPDFVASLTDILDGRDVKHYHWNSGRVHDDPPSGYRAARLDLPGTDGLEDWYWAADVAMNDDPEVDEDLDLHGPFRTRDEAVNAAWIDFTSDMGR